MSPQRAASQNSVTYNLVPFNFVDLEEKAAKHIAHVNEESARIVNEARGEVERIRKVAADEWQKSSKEIEQNRANARAEAETIRKQLDELRQRLHKEEENFKTRKEQLENEAADMKEQLKQNEEIAKKNGYEEGHQSGYKEGHTKGYKDGETQALIDYTEKVTREAQIQLGAQLETLLPALTAMIDRLDQAKQSFLQRWEQGAIKVAEAIAAKAINRQLPEMVDVPMRLLREALELGTGSTSLRIRLNKNDYTALKPQMDLLIQEMTRSVKTEIVGDGAVTPGGCILETPQGIIDNQITSRLERIEQELCLVEEH